MDQADYVLKLVDHAADFPLVLVDEFLEMGLGFGGLLSGVDDVEPYEEGIPPGGAPGLPVSVFAHSFTELAGVSCVELSAVQFQDVDEKDVAFLVRSIPFGVGLRFVSAGFGGDGRFGLAGGVAAAAEEVFGVFVLPTAGALVDLALLLGGVVGSAEFELWRNGLVAVLVAAGLR